MDDDGRFNHHLAWAIVIWSEALPRGRHQKRLLLAFELVPGREDLFPMFFAADVVCMLADDLDHDEVVAVLQHAEGQLLSEDGGPIAGPSWSEQTFEAERYESRLIAAAHVEPTGRGESVRLTFETNSASVGKPISALAAWRLRDGVRAYLAAMDLPDADAGEQEPGAA